MTMSAARANDSLEDSLLSPATPHLWLHTGDPGVNGTDNVAQESASDIDRKAISFAAVSNHPSNTERRVLSNASVSWSGAEIDASQEITHFSIHSAGTGGQCEYIDEVTESKTTGSDGVTVDSGDIEVALEVHAKP